MIQADRDLAAELARPKYAHFERERRWLVRREARPDFAAADYTLIEDRYLAGSRLRLRRMSKPGGTWTTCKLTKKYEAADPSVRQIVTAYLSDEEYALFRTLPGSDVIKRRYHLQEGATGWSLDIFEGGLTGLEVLESEAADDASLAELTAPSWADREITHEAHYQGGSLAHSQTIPED